MQGNPRTFGKLRVGFHQNEVIPHYKVALLTMTVGNLGAPKGIGRGLQPADPVKGGFADSKGFKLLCKGMTCRAKKIVGDYQPAESPEAYMTRLAQAITPVTDAAVDWTSNAGWRARNFLRPRFGENPEEAPEEYVPLHRRFTQGDTEGEDYVPSRPAEIYTADGRQLDEDLSLIHI